MLAAACGGTEPSAAGETPARGTPPAPDGAGASGTSTPAAPQAIPAGVPANAPAPSTEQTGFLDDPDDQPVIVPAELDDATACAGLELVPEQVEVEVPMDITTTTEVLQPVAFYILLDNSSSMDAEIPADDTTAGAPITRWDLAVTSLQAFVTSPESEGLDVAIQYFNPAGEQGNFGQGMDEVAVTDDPLCNGAFHGTPDVEMGRLPDNSQALVDSLDTTATSPGTPTVGALTGGVQYCQAFEAANPGENCVVVVVTDGVPSACGLDGGGQGLIVDAAATDMLVAITSAGFAAGIETFAVGMDGVPPDGFTLLDTVAAAGGTDCTPPEPGGESCNVSSTGSQGLVDTLNSIRETITVTETVTEVTTVIETQKLDCQWLIPDPPEDESLDPNRVNVNLSLDGAEPTIVPGVEDAAACATNGGIGWYYDNPEMPTTIFACTESCSQIQNGVSPVVNILLGCERVVIEVMR